MKLIAGLLILFSSTVYASSENFSKALKSGKVRYITDSGLYKDAMESLLAKGWKLGSRSLKVHYKADPNQDPQPDYSEVKVITVTDAEKIQPEEIGLSVGDSDASIYAGPFVVGQDKNRYAFVLTVDGRTWGYDRNRYFVLFKPVSSLKDPKILTEVEAIPEKKAYSIKTGAEHLLPAAYASLSQKGKDLLTQLSNQKWKQSVTFETTSPWSSQLMSLTYSQSLEFKFWEDFKRMDYTARVSHPSGSAGSGPFTTIPEIFNIGEKEVTPGIYEFAIMAGNRWAMYEHANHLDFYVGNPKIFNAKSWEEAEEIFSEKFTYSYCYRGFNCSEMYAKLSFSDVKFYDASARILVLRYNESKPETLEVRYELATNPRIEALKLKTVFQAE